ncbi:ATP synthase F0 sector subunit b [hydrothermal vent metagenome]|uniref:ATP synthase F0 sector subunit b n=1 Tax=hydrothermal vent metagenome TaxID=652676 RepID=A0A1W1EJ85_9ZZZZ
MKFMYLAILALPTIIFASDITITHSDFFYRVFNFSIFVGLLYYLISNPIKEFFIARRDGIENQLTEIERRLEETKKAKEDALARVEDSKEKSKEIIETAKKEAKLLADKIAQNNQKDLDILDKNYTEKCDNELRRMNRDIIDEVLNDSINNEDISLSTPKVVELVNKKVA